MPRHSFSRDCCFIVPSCICIPLFLVSICSTHEVKVAKIALDTFVHDTLEQDIADTKMPPSRVPSSRERIIFSVVLETV